MDSPNWKTGRPLCENQDQSFEEEEGSSDVDEELMEKYEEVVFFVSPELSSVIVSPELSSVRDYVITHSVRSM